MTILELNHRKIVFPNGLTLLILRNERLPLLTVSFYLRAGKDSNPMRLPGLSSLCIRLLDEGTANYRGDQISRLLEGQGASLSAFSRSEVSGLWLEMKKGEEALGLELLSEMVRSPLFPPAAVKKERSRLINHVEALSDEPETVGSQRLNFHIYKGSPLAYPLLGTEKSLNSITRDHLKAFHRRHFRPDNAFLVIVGDVAEDQVVGQALEWFGSWQPAGPEGKRPAIRFRKQTGPIDDCIEMEKEQVSLYLGHLGIRRSNPDYYCLQVLDTVLGGGPGFTSRIPARLRDDLGLVYVAYSDIAGSAGAHPGRFVAYAATSPERIEAARAALLEEIRRIRDEKVGGEELDTAKDFLTGNYVFELQSNSSLSRLLLGIEVFALGDDHLACYPHYIGKIGAEDLQRVARKYLDTLNYTMVRVGPQPPSQTVTS